MPCFVQGNRTPTLPHSFGTSNCQGAVADSRKFTNSRNGLYELNTWMSRYGRGQVRRVTDKLLTLTVPKAKLQQKAAISDARTRAAETVKRGRNEWGAEYYSQNSQEAIDGSASETLIENLPPVVFYSIMYTVTMIYNIC